MLLMRTYVIDDYFGNMSARFTFTGDSVTFQITKTTVPAMLMENCCYGREEMAVLNMVQKGLFGEVPHCLGSYSRDINAVWLIK